jgi:hypothetical protein
MRKLLLVCIVIAAIAILSIAMAETGNFPALTPATTASPSPTATPTPTPTIEPGSNLTSIPISVPYDFKISAISSFNITQGNSMTTQIGLSTISGNASSVDPQDILWRADSGSSDMHFDFKTSYSYENEYWAIYFPDRFIPNGFSCMLTITVPSSTPTDSYGINITAKIGSNSHSISMLVSVPSATVSVSGTVDTSILGITPSQIAFRDQAYPNTYIYKGTLTGNTYSISVPNNREYLVMISDSTGSVSGLGWSNWISDSCSVKVPVGSTAMTKDFTVPPKSVNPIVTVSGSIIDGISGIKWSHLQFQNRAAPAKVYYGSITESATYSIDLPNYSDYQVCIDNGTAPWHLVEIDFSVKVPAERVTLTKDFTVLQPVTFPDPDKINR